MDSNRLFMIGVILLLLGIQFRLVESFELNEMATRVVNKRFPSQSSPDTVTNYVSQDPYADPWSAPAPAAAPATRTFSPPRPLAFTFISIGAILVLASPTFKK